MLILLFSLFRTQLFKQAYSDGSDYSASKVFLHGNDEVEHLSSKDKYAYLSWVASWLAL